MIFDDFDTEVSPEETLAYEEHLEMVERLENEEEISVGSLDDLEAFLYDYEEVDYFFDDEDEL